MELKKAIEIAEAYNNWLSGGFKNFTYTVTERKMALVVLIQLGKNKLHNID